VHGFAPHPFKWFASAKLHGGSANLCGGFVVPFGTFSAKGLTRPSAEKNQQDSKI